MNSEYQPAVCQRCGMGFTLTPQYRNFLARWGARVIVPVLCPKCFSRVGPLPKQNGIVKRFIPRKRFGFILTEEGQEVFFHRSQLVGGNEHSPRVGQHARFHVRCALKGPEALNVELIAAQPGCSTVSD